MNGETALWATVEELRRQLDALTALQGPLTWANWTPVVTQSGTPTFTTTYARYAVNGKQAFLTAKLVFTATGTGGNDIIVSGIPSDAQPNRTGGTNGVFRFVDSGTNFRVGVTRVVGANDLRFTVDSGTDDFGTNPNVAIAVGDELSFSVNYEIP